MTGYLRYTRAQRLGSADIKALLARGRRFRRAGVLLHVSDNGDRTGRLGLIVPRRLARRAVDRNRLKRQVREWFRLHQERYRGRDILVRLVGKPDELFPAVAQLLDDLP